MEFVGLKGETLVRAPGSINGESFSIKNLEECSVFILDYSSEVEVADCTNCQIFIGPVDGPALFSGCSNCQVAVASHTFKAQSCSNCEFGVFSATQPALQGCSGIRIACWSGAYPQLTQHFAAANLDPAANQWANVYDGSAGEEGAGGAPNFQLVTDAGPQYWEVPLDNFGPCENPVPGPEGQVYQPAATPAAAPAAPSGGADEFSFEAAAPAENGPSGGGPALGDDFVTAGGEHVPSHNVETLPSGMLEPAAAGSAEHPRVTAAKQALQQRLKEQAQAEAEQKQAIKATAGQYLEAFYERRNKSKEERIRAQREALEGKGHAEHGPEGDGQWARITSMIDFNLSRPNGSDLSRFKSVLFTAKAKPSTPAAA